MEDKKKKIIFFDDSVDIGKKPLKITNPEHKKVREELMKKYSIK